MKQELTNDQIKKSPAFYPAIHPDAGRPIHHAASERAISSALYADPRHQKPSPTSTWTVQL